MKSPPTAKPSPKRTGMIPKRAGRLQTENALILHQRDLTLRPITGPDELDLFNSLPYVLNEEVGGDLAAGHRRRSGCGSPCAVIAWWPGPDGGRGWGTSTRC
jgi:hypothetical protein